MGSSSIETWLPYQEAEEILKGLLNTYYGDKSGRVSSGISHERSGSQQASWLDNAGLPIIGHTCYNFFWIPWKSGGKDSYHIESESCGCQDRTRQEILRRYQHTEAHR